MSKGDKVTLHIRNDVGPTQKFEVVATRNGQTIDIREPRANERMYAIAVVSKNGKDDQVHSFARDAVIAIIDERTP